MASQKLSAPATYDSSVPAFPLLHLTITIQHTRLIDESEDTLLHRTFDTRPSCYTCQLRSSPYDTPTYHQNALPLEWSSNEQTSAFAL